jgi:hypothetical protein
LPLWLPGITRFMVLWQRNVPGNFRLRTVKLLISDKLKITVTLILLTARQTVVWSKPSYYLASVPSEHTATYYTVESQSHIEIRARLPIAQFSYLSHTSVSLMLVLHLVALPLRQFVRSHISNRCHEFEMRIQMQGHSECGANEALCPRPPGGGMRLHDSVQRSNLQHSHWI